MEEIEAPTEHLHEHIQQEAEKAAGHAHGGHDRLAMRVALSSVVIAVLAAVSALHAGHHANEAVIEQMQAADQWSYFQAKGIKLTVLSANRDLLTALGKELPAESLARIEGYKKEQAQIEEKAHESEQASAAHLHHYKTLANGVTLFQVGIAMAAMAVLTRRRPLWYVSLLLGMGGAVFLALGLF